MIMFRDIITYIPSKNKSGEIIISTIRGLPQ